MILNSGDIHECPQCGARIHVLAGNNWDPLQLADFNCTCGEKLMLVQSGSESVQGADPAQNKLLYTDIADPANSPR